MKDKKLEEFKLILILALLVGCICVAPHIFLLITTEHYNPLSIESDNSHLDEALYAAGAMEVVEGNLIPSDLVVYEHKDEPFFYGPVPFLIMGSIARIINIKNTIIFSDFLFNALIFILFYYLSNIFLDNKRLSIISSLTLIFFYYLFIPPASISLVGLHEHLAINLFNFGNRSASLFFSRFTNPQIPVIFFFLTIILLYFALKKQKIYYYLLAGLSFALNFYSYFYYWTYLLIFFVLLSLFFFYKGETKKSAKLLISLAFGLALAIPYFINFLALQNYNLIARSGIEIGRFIELISIIYLILYSLLFLIYKNKGLKFYIFSSLFLTGILVLNVQLILGYTIQNNHWNSRAIVPFLIIFALLLLREVYLKLRSRFKLNININAMLYLFITILVILSINFQFQNIRKLPDNYGFSDSEYELLQKLELLPKESVILTSSLAWNMWIPAYTKNNVYFPYSASTLSSDDEITERFMITYNLLNKTKLEIERQLYAKSRYTRIAESIKVDDSFNSYLRAYIFLDKIYPIKRHGLLKYYSYNKSIVDALVEQYPLFEFSPEKVRKYRVDYILLLGEEKFLEDYLKGDIIFKQGEFLLFKLTKSF